MRQNEGLHEFYRASSQQDIDNFVRYVGPAMSYPPAFNARPQVHDGLQQRQEAQPMNPAALHQQNGNAHAQQPARQQLYGPNAEQAQRWRQQQGNAQPDFARFAAWDQAQAQQQQQQQQQQQAFGLAPILPPQANVVPFPAKFRQKQTGVSGTPGSVPAGFVDTDSSDPRPVLLFDLNGTLTSHRAAKSTVALSSAKQQHDNVMF